MEDHLKLLKYDSPIALSCDDTKLLAALHPYYDQELDGYYVIGHVGEPYHIADVDPFHQVAESGILEKATKVWVTSLRFNYTNLLSIVQLHLWCLQVPLPKVMPLIVAAMGISNKLSAEELFPHLWHIITGLLDRHIQITSYAADGSGVECGVQQLLEEKAVKILTTKIKHPGKGCQDVFINIPFFSTSPSLTPIANLQDSKHLLKTFQNNLFSDARLLTFPNGVAMFSQVCEMVFQNNSPLYHQDVEKLDHQDDNAATRLFCGDTLQWLKDNRSGHYSLIIYLFVFGELIDAYQSHTLSITEHVQLVLCAQFFLEMWQKFLAVAGYPKVRHYISQQCADITEILIKGFLKLVIIYRDHVEGSPPLFPWLLTTEVVEHIFGLCWQIVKDFMEKEFRDMVAKLFIKLWQAIFSFRESNGKACTSGYNHTYMDMRGTNLSALSAYLTNEAMNEAATRAYGEAESLFALLGVSATELQSPSATALPSINSWLEDTDNPFDSQAVSEHEDLWDEEDKPTEDYQSFLDILENANLKSS